MMRLLAFYKIFSVLDVYLVFSIFDVLVLGDYMSK